MQRLCRARLCPAVVLLAAAMSSAAPRAAVWTEPSLAGSAPVPTDVLTAWLTAAGVDPAPLATDRLVAPGALDPAATSLLVLPYGAAYPAAGRPALLDYLRGGGQYLALGGAAFTAPLYRVGDAWRRWDELGDKVRELGSDTAWAASVHGPEDQPAASGNGTADQPVTLTTTELRGWSYAAARLPVLPDEAAGLAFEARGDERTPLLCLELTEQDGSRWKQVVPLSTEWRTYRLPTAAFPAYASPARSGAADRFHAERGQMLLFGLTRGMVGGGEHRLEVRRIAFHRSAVPADAFTAATMPPTARALVDRALGASLAPSAAGTWPSCCAQAEPLTGVAELRPMAGDAVATKTAAWPLPAFAPPTPDGKVYLFPGSRERTWRLTPVLEARDAAGRPLGCVAGIVSHTAGAFAGSRWAAVAVERVEPAVEPLIAAAVRQMAVELTSSPVLGDLTPRFEVAGGRALASFGLSVMARPDAPLAAAVTVSWEDRQGRPRGATLAAHAAARSRVELRAAPVALAELGRDRYRAVAATGDGPARREVVSSLDARRTLRELADFLTAEGADDGKFSGIAFVDHRGARMLCGAYEIFGDQRYREAALRWGRAMVAEQRDDGGYRMGYGITARGEECYVADGGEIALGIARLVRYADEPERGKLLASLKAYLGYRDSFRVAGGGIGVGWCLSDYGQRPITRLETPTKVFAPELNTYTIGCTLAAACATEMLTGDAALQRANDADADWLMPRVKSLTGAFAESFVYAHATARDPARRKLYAEYLRERFLEPLLARSGPWWLSGGGRSSLDLASLLYCLERLEPTPEAEVCLARAVHGILSPDSPVGLHRLIGRHGLNHDEWIYLCFGGVGLADLVRPVVTMEGLEREG